MSLIVDIKSDLAVPISLFVKGYLNTNLGYSVSGEVIFYLFCEGDEEVNIVYGLRDDKAFQNKYSMEYATTDKNLIDIILLAEKKGIVIDTLEVIGYKEDKNLSLGRIVVNDGRDLITGEWYLDKSIDKIVLVMDKNYYSSLSDKQKSSVKSNFLFRKDKSWVSRSKYPNTWRAENVARELGLIHKGSFGERKSFEEKQQSLAERSERRAEYYEKKSEEAVKRGNDLQKPINDRSGDIAFFTQPNINSSSGRSFTRARERMFNSYFKGFEEFKRSEYYAEKAEMAMATAKGTKPTSKSFIVRRLNEVEKTISAQKKNLDLYNERLNLLREGKVLKRLNGAILTEEDTLEWIEKAEDTIDMAISKSIYYHKCLDEIGGLEFSKENVKKGYIVDHERWGKCKVTGIGPKNFTYKILEGGASGMGGKANYSEILEILEFVEDKKPEGILHPFKVGDKFNPKIWDSSVKKFVTEEFVVTKISSERVSLKSSKTGKTVVRKPYKHRNYGNNDAKESWFIEVEKGSMYGIVTKFVD